MSLIVKPYDPQLLWQGAVSLQHTEGWTMPWRLLFEERELSPPDQLLSHAAMLAGVRIAFRSDTDILAGTVEPNPDLLNLDLLCAGVRIESFPLAGRREFRFESFEVKDKLIELWLPQAGEFRLCGLELRDGASLSAFEDERPCWITYGSSITQCKEIGVESPTQTWPAIVAREHGFNLACLGYGEQCHLDSMVARMIRDLSEDFISLCVGINIQGAFSLSPRTFRPALIGFISIIRERHSEIPMLVTLPIHSPERETCTNKVGFKLSLMRKEVAAGVAVLQAHSDSNLHYLDGRELFGPDTSHLLPDGLHPNAEGYRIIAHNFLRHIKTGGSLERTPNRGI